MKIFLKMISCTVCIATIFLHSGCGGVLFTNYGRVTPDLSVKDAFEKYQVNPNYNYYVSGSDVYPSAIIGLDRSYRLEPDLWKRIEMTPQKLRELVHRMREKVTFVSWGQVPYGFAMFDDRGKQIGVWYSVLEARTSLKVKEDRTVEIITPDIDIYEH